jgi:hypothetical protein
VAGPQVPRRVRVVQQGIERPPAHERRQPDGKHTGCHLVKALGGRLDATRIGVACAARAGSGGGGSGGGGGSVGGSSVGVGVGGSGARGAVGSERKSRRRSRRVVWCVGCGGVGVGVGGAVTPAALDELGRRDQAGVVCPLLLGALLCVPHDAQHLDDLAKP